VHGCEVISVDGRRSRLRLGLASECVVFRSSRPRREKRLVCFITAGTSRRWHHRVDSRACLAQASRQQLLQGSSWRASGPLARTSWRQQIRLWSHHSGDDWSHLEQGYALGLDLELVLPVLLRSRWDDRARRYGRTVQDPVSFHAERRCWSRRCVEPVVPG